VEFLKQNWHWAALALASGTMLVIDLLRNSGGAESLSPVDATLKINREDAVVIDVRDQAEFAAGHIANARHIALADLPKRMGELEKLKSKPIILCCQSGARSAGAQATLKTLFRGLPQLLRRVLPPPGRPRRPPLHLFPLLPPLRQSPPRLANAPR
jgi:rhodanese-related sulfurtransferase